MRIPYSQVESEWKTREADPIAKWEPFFQKKGFKTWELWRNSMIQTLKLNALEWEEVKLENPQEQLQRLYCNALIGWRRFYKNRYQSTFADLALHPFFENHEKVEGLKNNPPEKATLITITNKTHDPEIVIDGHHRSLTIPQVKNFEGEVYLHRGIIEDALLFQHIFEGDWTLLTKRLLLDQVNRVKGTIYR